jgi:hypothetical protein
MKLKKKKALTEVLSKRMDSLHNLEQLLMKIESAESDIKVHDLHFNSRSLKASKSVLQPCEQYLTRMN